MCLNCHLHTAERTRLGQRGTGSCWKKLGAVTTSRSPSPVSVCEEGLWICNGVWGNKKGVERCRRPLSAEHEFLSSISLKITDTK